MSVKEKCDDGEEASRFETDFSSCRLALTVTAGKTGMRRSTVQGVRKLSWKAFWHGDVDEAGNGVKDLVDFYRASGMEDCVICLQAAGVLVLIYRTGLRTWSERWP